MTGGGCATKCVVAQAESVSDSAMQARDSGLLGLDGVLCSMEVRLLLRVDLGRVDGRGGAGRVGDGLDLRDDRRRRLARYLRIVEAQPHEHGGHDDQDADDLKLRARGKGEGAHVTRS